jgi:enoyl-CoA hydratase
LNQPVLFGVEGALARITLNRPEALHALTQPMCAAMSAQLRAWEADAAIQAVLIDHAGSRGFCAGGDLRMLAKSGAGDGAEARAFFAAEYALNALIQSYSKPYIAILDGVTMGGGVGISVHGRYRVATERTLFAMPETGIGLFPDVGGGWFLPRLPGRVGVWLALTGARLKASDCLYIGVATHYVSSARVEALAEALRRNPHDAGPILEAFHETPGPPPLAMHRAEIDRLFSSDRVEEIFATLAADGGAWAAEQGAALRTKSPQAMKIALRQMRRGARLASFAENMRMEYRLASRVIHTHDFIEGVRAVIADKDNAPRWSPQTAQQISDTALDEFFAPLPPGEDLPL